MLARSREVDTARLAAYCSTNLFTQRVVSVRRPSCAMLCEDLTKQARSREVGAHPMRAMASLRSNAGLQIDASAIASSSSSGLRAQRPS